MSLIVFLSLTSVQVLMSPSQTLTRQDSLRTPWERCLPLRLLDTLVNIRIALKSIEKTVKDRRVTPLRVGHRIAVQRAIRNDKIRVVWDDRQTRVLRDDYETSEFVLEDFPIGFDTG